MPDNMEQLKISNILRGFSRRYASVTCRKTNCFVYRNSGHIRYIFPNCCIEVSPGEMILLPKGISYEFEVLSQEDSEFFFISFEGDLDSTSPATYQMDGFYDLNELINLTELWRIGDKSERYKCYSVFYSLLSYIEKLEKRTSIDKKKLDIILPAISYMTKHIYDGDFTTEKLYQLCGISGTYFRKIFELNYGVSPQKYILGKRLSYAKALIDNGAFDSISEIAYSAGYTDPLYFSRAFKKKYGISPSKYKET